MLYLLSSEKTVTVLIHLKQSRQAKKLRDNMTPSLFPYLAGRKPTALPEVLLLVPAFKTTS